MSAVWDRLFGNAPPPANDGPQQEPTEEAPTLSRPTPPAEEQRDSPQRQSLIVAGTFDSIGRRNESLRAQLDAIEFAFSNIEMIRAHFLQVLAPIDDILHEIERTKTKHLDAERRLESLSAAHDKLKGEHSELTVDRNAMTIRQTELTQRFGDLEKAGEKIAAEFAEARAAQAAHSGRADRLERELDDSRRRLAAVNEQLPSLRAEFVAREKRLQEVEQQRASLEDRYNLAAQENKSMRARIEDMVGSTSRLNRQINELEAKRRETERRVVELETALTQAASEHAKLKEIHLDESEGYRLSAANMREEINALNVRSEGAERLLSEARTELRDGNAKIRALEQAAHEQSVLLQTREQAQADLERSLTAAHGKYEEAEAARTALDARASELSRDLTNKTLALKRADEKAEALEARLASEVKLAISELENRDATIAKLRADLESQSAARAFAEGALQSARQERVSWHRAMDGNPTPGGEGIRERLNRLRA